MSVKTIHSIQGFNVKRLAGRDIVRIDYEDYPLGFYRSSGQSSRMPNVWLPFDGVGLNIVGSLWFVKSAYTSDNVLLHRFGNLELKTISVQLGQEDIPKGELTTPYQINFFIDSPISREWNKVERIRNWKPENNPQHWK